MATMETTERARKDTPRNVSGRTSDKTKLSLKTTEFFAMVGVIGAILIASAVSDSLGRRSRLDARRSSRDRIHDQPRARRVPAPSTSVARIRSTGTTRNLRGLCRGARPGTTLSGHANVVLLRQPSCFRVEPFRRILGLYVLPDGDEGVDAAVGFTSERVRGSGPPRGGGPPRTPHSVVLSTPPSQQDPPPLQQRTTPPLHL